ncbi:uncharacterized protein J4E87_007982 [Alternaria ethzedia]|uniref:uncharacterized protein n=1 Tax=Alternaria ethzedia TaxID=181014 RepID=UPI0020C2D6D7|nr:uncharacterized protein J4E87_007982 [Alternaria ethzedia]KAI4618314.1 hypothetical protein J4E87_007982 [Alternaria ethzedia]
MAQTGGTYHRESSWSYSVSIGGKPILRSRPDNKEHEPDARPPKPSYDAEKEDETNISEDWESVEWPIAQPTVEPVVEPMVDDTEPEEVGYRNVRSQFTFDVGWGSWRTTVFKWDMNARFKES